MSWIIFHSPVKCLIYYHLFWCFILDIGELFTVPQCQEFLVTVQSDSRRRLRISLITFLKAATATARHSRLSHRVKSQELQLKLVV